MALFCAHSFFTIRCNRHDLMQDKLGRKDTNAINRLAATAWS